jgi:hypothetical protein
VKTEAQTGAKTDTRDEGGVTDAGVVAMKAGAVSDARKGVKATVTINADR